MDRKGHAIVKQSPTAGLGLFATKDLEPGHLIFELDRALVGTLDTALLGEHCSNCYIQAGAIDPHATQSDDFSKLRNGMEIGGATIRECSGCSLLAFCGKKCQAESWKKYHKHECKTFAAIPIERRKQLPNAVRAAIQLLTSRAKGKMSDETWSSILRLHSHADEMRIVQGNRFDNVAMGVWKYAKVEETIGFDVAQRIWSLVLTNSLTLVTTTYDPLGVYFDPFAVLANHSCEPNAFVGMDGPKLQFRALNAISKDEEITISYIDNTNPFHIRQMELKDRYFFDCKCIKCSKGATLREDQVLKATSNDDVDGLSEVDLLNLVEKSKSLRNQREQLEQGLRHYSGRYHIARQPYPTLRQELMATLNAEQQSNLAFPHAVKLHFEILPILYPQPHHPLRVVGTYVLASMLQQLSGDSYQGEGQGEVPKMLDKVGVTDIKALIFTLLADTEKLAYLSHGPNSTFMSEVKMAMAGLLEMTGNDFRQKAQRGKERQLAALRKIGNIVE